MHRWCTSFLMILAAIGISGTSWVLAEDEYAKQRAAMIKEIEADSLATSLWTGRKRMQESVLAAMDKVPRHRFVPKRHIGEAYDNRPLPIGFGQTISQPYIVALMTDLLDVEASDTVLEIGTGSGYQAAVLAELVKEVHTIEIVQELGEQARERLNTLGYHNISVRLGDGYYGIEEHAPFDAIIVTAAASHIPPPLVKQLKPQGRMVIPVGSPFMTQQLVLVEKKPDGQITTKQILPVRFVPLTGEH